MTGQGNELQRQIILDALASQSPIGLALVDDDLYEVPKHYSIQMLLVMFIASLVTFGAFKLCHCDMLIMPSNHGNISHLVANFPSTSITLLFLLGMMLLFVW